jgi:hypothetical protein
MLKIKKYMDDNACMDLCLELAAKAKAAKKTAIV